MGQQKINVIARVDHAGEKGAVRIYQGQSAIFRQTSPETAQQIEELARHEQEHLDYFDSFLAEHSIRPTIFLPLWHVGGFALGAMTALLGRQASFACTQSVEEVIDEHYSRQIELLDNDDAKLKQAITRFRDDERDHHRQAVEENQDDYPLLRGAIALLCRGAIALSSRF